MSKPYLVTEDKSDVFNELIKRFKNDEVLVGIPESDDVSRDSKDGTVDLINNATILAINEFGSPVNNIPPRPVMAIGIKNAQEEIAEQFKAAVKAGLAKGLPSLSVYYNRVGIIASTSVKKAINSQIGIDEPAESTLAARKAQGFKGTKALIVSGQMRNAITYVVTGEAS